MIEDDGRTWKMTLRDGMTFHDGTPVLARDAIASIDRWGRNDPFGQNVLRGDGRAVGAVGPGDPVPAEEAVPAADDGAGQAVVLLPGDAGAAGADAADPAGDGDGGQRAVPLHGRGAGVRLARGIREVRGLRAPAGRHAVLRGRAEASCTWTGWSGTPSRTPPPPRRRCSTARSTGGSSRPRTCCRCCAGIANLAVEAKEHGGSMSMIRFNHLQPPFDNPAIRRAFFPGSGRPTT